MWHFAPSLASHTIYVQSPTPWYRPPSQPRCPSARPTRHSQASPGVYPAHRPARHSLRSEGKLPKVSRHHTPGSDIIHSLGQSLTRFSPCLTSSSLKISNHANSTPFSLNRPTVWRENPHFGAEGLPFMNKTTSCLFISSLHRVVISSSVRGRDAGAGAAGVASGVVELADEVPECWVRSEWRRSVSAPE